MPPEKRLHRLVGAIGQRRPVERALHRLVERIAAEAEVAAEDGEVLVGGEIRIERDLLRHHAHLGARVGVARRRRLAEDARRSRCRAGRGP